jgi:hypothetical protein
MEVFQGQVRSLSIEHLKPGQKKATNKVAKVGIFTLPWTWMDVASGSNYSQATRVKAWPQTPTAWPCAPFGVSRSRGYALNDSVVP